MDAMQIAQYTVSIDVMKDDGNSCVFLSGVASDCLQVQFNA